MLWNIQISPITHVKKIHACAESGGLALVLFLKNKFNEIIIAKTPMILIGVTLGRIFMDSIGWF